MFMQLLERIELHRRITIMDTIRVNVYVAQTTLSVRLYSISRCDYVSVYICAYIYIYIVWKVRAD